MQQQSQGKSGQSRALDLPSLTITRGGKKTPRDVEEPRLLSGSVAHQLATDLPALAPQISREGSRAKHAGDADSGVAAVWALQDEQEVTADAGK